MKVAAALIGLVAACAPAGAIGADRRLAALTRGRAAGAPVDCIRPETAILPEIVDRQAIVYRATSTLYVVRPAGECGGLRDGAQLRTSSIGGRLCRGEQFRVTFPAGASGARLCTFGAFVPYRRAR